MELAQGYREWSPPAALAPVVSCLWTSVVPDADRTVVLPDGCTDIIWRQGTGAFVAGPDTGPVPSAQPPGTVLTGVRLRPGAGPVLGLPLTELLDQRVDLAGLHPRLAARLPGDLTPAQALTALIALTTELAADHPPDPLVSQAARLLAGPTDRATDRGTGRGTDRAGELASQLGVSERQLRRRCLAAVGYGPKTLHRVLRFRRFVSQLDGAERPVDLDLARAAAEAGYADQAHLTRESVRLGGLPPAALVRARRVSPA